MISLSAIFATGAIVLAANALRMLRLWARGTDPVSLDDPFINASAAFLFFTLALVFAQ